MCLDSEELILPEDTRTHSPTRARCGI